MSSAEMSGLAAVLLRFRLNSDNWWILALAVNVALFTLIFGVVYLAVKARRKRQRRVAAEFARDLGLKDIWHSGRRNETDWYVGEYSGLPLLLHGRVITIGGGKNRQNNYCVRICLGVPGRSAKGIEVRRDIPWGDRSLARKLLGASEVRDFESAFTFSEAAGEKLPFDFKESLLSFRQSYPGSFLLMDVARVSVGNWKFWFPEKGLPEAPAVLLVHDAYQREIEGRPEELRKRLDDFATIARDVQRGSWSAPDTNSAQIADGGQQ